jgi:hypothetical protein
MDCEPVNIMFIFYALKILLGFPLLHVCDTTFLPEPVTLWNENQKHDWETGGDYGQNKDRIKMWNRSRECEINNRAPQDSLHVYIGGI